MDNITFTGIKNIHVYQGINRLNGPNAPKILKITAKLTDDASGSDLADFHNYNNKVKKYFKNFLVNPDDSSMISLEYIPVIVTENVIKNMFKLNNVMLQFNNDAVIPVFEFMAKFTSRAADAVDSPAQKELINTINRAIEKDAYKYFR